MKKLWYCGAMLAAFSANAQYDTFDSNFYFGIGVGGKVQDAHATIYANGYEDKLCHSRLQGTIFLGSGKTLNGHPFYIGGELYMDIAKTGRRYFETNRCRFALRNNGIVPGFCLRFGYSGNDMKLLYFKVGFAHVKATLCNETPPQGVSQIATASKIVPLIGVGIEQSLSRKHSARVEAEFRFKGEKKEPLFAKAESGYAITVRAAYIYNVQM